MLAIGGISLDLTTLVMIIIVGIGIIFGFIWLTKRSKIKTVDKMKILSEQLVRSNRFNYANPLLFIIRNKKKLFRVITASFFKFKGEKVYFFNVKSLIPGSRLPNPISRTFILIVSEKNFAINGENVVLNHNFTLQNFYNIVFNSSDLAYDYIEEFSRMIDKNIVDSAFYAQIQRNTVVTFGSPAKELGEKTQTQIDEEKIKNVV